MRLALVLLLALLLACSRATIDRAEWQNMRREERVLYVKSLIAEEQSKEAKGGNGRRIDRAAEEYVAMIDAAYARGEQRAPQQVFAEVAR